MSKQFSNTEIALKEAQGYRILFMDGKPMWVKDRTFTNRKTGVETKIDYYR